MRIPKSLSYKSTSFLTVASTASMILAGCSTQAPHPDDPWYGWNRAAYTFNDDADRFVIKPVSQAYQWITPDFVDEGVTNVFDNISDVRVTINDFLQLKMAQGGMDLSRFLINSTVGLGGMIDVATMFDLPKHNEDFGQTLGVWGVESGPYLVLPLFGPSSPRDAAGRIGDALFNPLTYVAFIGGAASIATSSSRAVDIIDTRSDALASEKIIDEAASTSVNGEYNFIKSAYEQRRDYLIEDGKAPEEDFEFELDDELETDSNAETAEPTEEAAPSSGHKLHLDAPGDSE